MTIIIADTTTAIASRLRPRPRQGVPSTMAIVALAEDSMWGLL
jgi:hypothetical protein